MQRRILIVTLAFVVAALATSASPISPTNDNDDILPSKKVAMKDINGDPIPLDDTSYAIVNDEPDWLTYEPAKNKRKYYTSVMRNSDNQIKPSLNLEREGSDNTKQVVAASTANEDGLPNPDRFGSIAFNSREVRLVGPSQKEVEMKDDVASKMVVVLDNLSKEATEVWDQVNEKLDKGWKDIKRSEVWGQVNEKLDKGWTDLKTMVEGVVKPSSQRGQP